MFDISGLAVLAGFIGLGVVGLIVRSSRVGRTPICEALLASRSKKLNVEDRLGYRPAGQGPYQFLTQMPKNEVFQIEVSEREFRLPRLPQSWDGLSILHLTDLHFSGAITRAYFEQIMDLSAQLDPDLIVFTGDLLDDQKLTEWLPSTLGRLRAPLGRYFVLGNHDWYLQPELTRRAFQQIGWTNVAGECVTIQHHGHSMAIGGSELPWMGEHPDFNQSPADAFRLLLSHTPDNIPWAKEQGVDLMLAGHNHGGQVSFPVIGPVYAPSIYGCRYAGGAFWEDPTLMYVSRGVSGRQPIRWGCPPELTKITLRGER
jgi:predicted MPP superfamily phosphohydrolase